MLPNADVDVMFWKTLRNTKTLNGTCRLSAHQQEWRSGYNRFRLFTLGERALKACAAQAHKIGSLGC